MNESIKSIARHGLSFGGGYLVAKGVISADDANQLSGAVITILGVLWSAWRNKKAAGTPPPAP